MMLVNSNLEQDKLNCKTYVATNFNVIINQNREEFIYNK